MTNVKNTLGPWEARALGGHSVVLCPVLPGRNDSRAKVGYGYRDEAFSIAYPFLDDEDRVRMDFVCFSHEDARLIAAAPDLLEVAKRLSSLEHEDNGRAFPSREDIASARAAIAKAEEKS